MQKSMPGPEIRKPGRQDTHLWPSKEMPPARNDHVDVRVVGERRSPGVQYGGAQR